MPWVYSVSSSTPPNYTWTGLNTLNQHCSVVTVPSNSAITQLKVYASGKGGSVSTKLCLWSASGSHSLIRSSSTFTMASGSLSGGGQYWYSKSITAYAVQTTNYWVGLYRNPSGGHIAGTTASGGGTSYRKTVTGGSPVTMDGFSSHNKEFYVGAFYITAPSAPSSCAVSRINDNKMTITWNNNSSTDQPYDSIKLYRFDNVTGSYILLKTLSGTVESYTDTTTVKNKYYRYRIRAYNTCGYSSYCYTNYVYTTPEKPSNVVATRDGSNVDITWNDESTNESLFRIQSRESTDGGDTWGSWADVDTVLANNETYTDTSPYTYGQYRVRAEYTTTSLYSDYVESNEIVTLATPNQPTNLSPTENIDGDELNSFSWTHNPTDDTAQTKYSLQYRVQGGSFPGTPQYDEEISTVEGVDIASSTFTNGNVYEWQVKTWGEYATGSDWSEIATFNAYSRPTVTIDSPTAVDNYNYSELTMTWTFNQLESGTQTEYLAKLYNSDDELLETRRFSSNEETTTFVTKVENAETYTVTLQVKSLNLWSEEAETEFTIEFLQPTKPTFTLEEDINVGGVLIDISNPAVVYGYSLDSSSETYEDTYVDYINNTTNYDGNDLIVEYTSGTDFKGILLNFDTSDFIGKTINDATLSLTRKTALSTAPTSSVRYIKSSWDETTVTYSTLPTIDTTDYDSHLHTAGDSEDWDITTLISLIADGTITDFNGVYILPSATGYDDFNQGEATIEISIEAENAETDYNTIYRSINGGDWEEVVTDIPVNTAVTDYLPNVGGNNNYKIEAVSTTPSNNYSDEDDIDLDYRGYFYFNTGENGGDYIRLYGDVSSSETIDKIQENIQFEGRNYPVNFQSEQFSNVIIFSSDLLKIYYQTMIDIINSQDDIYYRDWNGRRFKCSLAYNKFDKKDNVAYQFTTSITRLED